MCDQVAHHVEIPTTTGYNQKRLANSIFLMRRRSLLQKLFDLRSVSPRNCFDEPGLVLRVAFCVNERELVFSFQEVFKSILCARGFYVQQFREFACASLL